MRGSNQQNSYQQQYSVQQKSNSRTRSDEQQQGFGYPSASSLGDSNYMRNFSTFNKQNAENDTYNQRRGTNNSQYSNENEQIESSLTPIQVMIRVRPQFNPASQLSVKLPDAKSIYISNNDNVHQFKFARVFNSREQQDSVFSHVCEPILQHALQGFNASFIVYGQTGTGKFNSNFSFQAISGLRMSGEETNYYWILGRKLCSILGKTHTMGLHSNNFDQEPGMIQHSLRYLFSHFSKIDPGQWQISMSFLQIYIEEIFDLLNPSGEKLQIREDTESNDVYVKNLVTVPIKNLDQALTLIEAGLNYRMLGSQDMNQFSSRSHTILNVYLQQKISSTEYIVSTIAFVDLAGSERIKKSNSTGLRMEEAKKINSSLSVLSNVISLLGQSTQQFIPYRDSKLTRILQNCLNNQSKISVIGTIEPSEENSFESYSTLQFANRCQDIQFLPQQNANNVFAMFQDPEEEIAALKSEIYEQTARIQELEQLNSFTTFMLDSISDTVSYLNEKTQAFSVQNSGKPAESNFNYRVSNSQLNYLRLVRFPTQDLKSYFFEGNEKDFVELFSKSFENMIDSYSNIIFKAASQSQTISSSKKVNSDEISTYYANAIQKLIEFTTAISEQNVKQLIREDDVGKLSDRNLSRVVQEYHSQTSYKMKEIIHRECSSINPSENSRYGQLLAGLMQTQKTNSFLEFSRSEQLRIEQLYLSLRKSSENTSVVESAVPTPRITQQSTTIQDYLNKQKLQNEQKIIANSTAVATTTITTTTIPNSQQSSQQLASQRNLNASTVTMNELLLSKRNATASQAQASSNISNTSQIVNSVINSDQKNSQSQRGMHSQEEKQTQQQKSQATSDTILIKRVKIIDEDDNNQQLTQKLNQLKQQYHHQQQQQQQSQRQNSMIEENSSKDPIAQIKRIDQFHTNTMSPIPQEQAPNTQLNSPNLQKKLNKYAPFHDA